MTDVTMSGIGHLAGGNVQWMSAAAILTITTMLQFVLVTCCADCWEVTVGKNSPGWERLWAPGVGSLGLCAGGEYPHPLAQQLSLLSSVFSQALVTGCTCSFCPLPLPATA